MHAPGRRPWGAARQAPGADTAMESRPGLHSSPDLSRAKRLSVGELRSLFEARCAAVAAAAARQLPDPAKRGCRPPNGVLRPVIPRLTVTAEESEEAQSSPQAQPSRSDSGWLRTDSSLHQQPRRLSTSSLSSTGSSSLLEDSEDDVLSDTEGRSQGIVHLEHGEDTNQVGGRGEGGGGAGRFACDARPHSSGTPSAAGLPGPFGGRFPSPNSTQAPGNSRLGASSSAIRYTGCCACLKNAAALWLF